jgi:hypothetical protein
MLRDYESREGELSPAQTHILQGYRYLIDEGLVTRELNTDHASGEQRSGESTGA